MKKTEKVISISFLLLCFRVVFLPAANASALSEPNNVSKSTLLLSNIIGQKIKLIFKLRALLNKLQSKEEAQI